ncbi:MAG TPA: DUF4190 domain-containing protein [Candidatus Pacearchaeota archaeon]|nr:hypothetical protein BMS3Abin17_00638 [archaeon BMS3Abin17]HDK42308.1 DUF4190 domain-containing protein [Candidatus Pacearchaeota archaeon]HDZ60669.1 DUF4190 domain-containing protein [Candidatus Pacearchaeota archaeon]
MSDKKDSGTIAYTLGIVSIVLAFFQPLAGIILGVIGLSKSKKEKSELSKRAKKLNIIGIILGVIIFIATIAVTAYFTIQGLNAVPSFPA